MDSIEYGDVALLGLGKSTEAAGAYLMAGHADSVTVYTGTSGADAAAHLASLGARVVEGSTLERGYDLGIVSPGIPATSAFFAQGSLMCKELVSEVELAWRASPRNWVAITGTNGKTTTTTLACELIVAGGGCARAVGNIGLPPISCVGDRRPGEVFVAEMSSFQLHSTPSLAAQVAVLLNVTPDHVEWHGSLEAYARDKARVFDNVAPSGLCLVGDDETCRAIEGGLRQRGLRCAVIGQVPSPCALDGAWVDETGMMRVRLRGSEQVLCAAGELLIKGPHNVTNALAAAACALEMGADPSGVAAGLRAFQALEHRVEPCGTVDSVSYFDDSKATNVDSVLKAVASFAPGEAIILLGGHDKGTDLGELAREVVARCRGAVVYGEAAQRFGAALAAEAARVGAQGFALECAPHMRQAFDRARELARPGQSVLLSPACSSFDEFSGYEERGRLFKEWVRELMACPQGSA